jgi:hypothetical protein
MMIQLMLHMRLLLIELLRNKLELKRDNKK